MKTKFAVIETGGKQYLVRPNSVIRIERIEKPKRGDAVHFDKVLLVVEEGINPLTKDFGGRVKLGDPYIKSAKIDGKLLKEGRYKKITHLRYHSKTRHAVKKGHRQVFSEIQIGDF
jgi:large subunit ribosomal protein L21